MEADYCVLCQDGHKMTQQCVAKNVQCKGCGSRGHVRKDCLILKKGNGLKFSGQSVGDGLTGQGNRAAIHYYPIFTKLSEEEREQIVTECVTDKVSPTILAKKWKCTSYFVKNLVQKAGKQLPKKYEKKVSNQTKLPNKSRGKVDNGNIQSLKQNRSSIYNRITEGRSIFALEDDAPLYKPSCLANRGVKRKASDPLVSSRPSKSARLLPEAELEIGVSELTLLNSTLGEPEPAKSTASSVVYHMLESSEEECGDIEYWEKDGDTNDNIICISDDEEIDSRYYSDKVITEHNSASSLCSLTDNAKPRREKKGPELMAGKYNIVCVHIEIFRSSTSSSSKLTQIGCVVLGQKQSTFFSAIKPSGVEDYLDHYKLGGDLLQALHMTREDNGTFLFRSRFEAVDEAKKIICTEESEALDKFLHFLLIYPKCILIGIDEDTVAIIVQKLRSRGGFKHVKGFTYWKRILKYLDVDGYKNIDLEEHHASTFGEDLPSFNTALDIADVLRKSVMEVTTKEKEGKRSVSSAFYKLCKHIGFIEPPQKTDHNSNDNAAEIVEVYSSFSPGVSATLHAEKLEQIDLSSESESEPEETGSCQVYTAAGLKKVLPFVSTSASREIDNRNQLENMLKEMESRERNWVARNTAIQELPNQHGVWHLGEPTPSEGTVICPSHKCKTRLRYSRVYLHISKHHPDILQKNLALLCPDCRLPVLPATLQAHLHQNCSKLSKPVTVAAKLSNRAKKITEISKKTLVTTKVSVSASVTARVLPPAPITASQQVKKSPAVVIKAGAGGRTALTPAALVLPGLSVLMDNAANAPTLAAQQSVLDSHLVNKFEPHPGAYVNCLWMYKNFQGTLMSEGHTAVLSPAKFVTVVRELAEVHWKIYVSPSGTRIEEEATFLKNMKSSHLYFKGFRIVD